MARYARSRSRTRSRSPRRRHDEAGDNSRSSRRDKDRSSRKYYSRSDREERDRDRSRDRSKDRAREKSTKYESSRHHRSRDEEKDRERTRHRSRAPSDSGSIETTEAHTMVRTDETHQATETAGAMDVGSTDQGHHSNGQMQSTGSSVTSAPTISIKTPNIKTEDVETPAESKGTSETSAEEKLRLRRERMEQWRRERLVKGGAQDTVKAESSDSTEMRKSVSVDAQTDIRSPSISMPSPIPSVKQEVSSPLNMSTVKSQSKTGTKFGFGKPKLGISLKPAAKPIKTKFVQPKASASFGFGDDDDEDSRMSALPTKKLRLLGPEDMDVDKSGSDEAEDVEDTLEAFMTDVTTEVQKLQESDQLAQAAAEGAQSVEEVAVNDDADSDEPEGPEDLIAAAAKKLAAKRKDLAQVDHSTVIYEPFRKDFYIEPPELADLTKEEVDIKRVELDGIKIRGARCPKPIEKWTQFGLPVGVQQVIGKVLKYDKPTPIQAQAIPAVMSGRDVIGIAKTGSGKTIAFLLPMFRHIKDQRPLEPQEGPIALIMTPTRELAVQIHKECKHFVRAMNLRTVCCYGGSPIKDNIAELKRGAEIIICTPGRMIDLLCANSGRVTNLRRVTYLVLDEADRMFDMGFEPQVMRIVNNVRPDRQTILFSATFPRKMEALARKILQKPLEITVGGRSVVASDVEQIVEVLQDDNAKFLRLLDILGRVMNEDPDAKVLIFTDRQDAADNLLTQLLRKGYPCQSIHGGKDQADRDSSISDFKSGDTNILIATSVAARGLDVKQLKVVVNYECPNHMEDYVHRVGRTGRAGNKGTAYTFITPDQDKYAVDIVKALKMSEVPIPEGLQQLADVFIQKVKSGTAQYSSSGFGGKGLEQLEKERDIVKKMQKIAHGAQYGEVEEEEDEEEVDVKFEAKAVPAGTAAKESTPVARAAAAGGAPGAAAAAVKAAQEAAAKVNAAVGTTGAQRARDIIAEINAKFKDAAAGGVGADDKKQASEAAYAYEIEINDYPQKARWRVTNKEQISQITEISGAAITTRGTFFPAGKQPGPGERKLYLFIEGDTQFVIDKAKAEIKRIITEATISSMESEAAGGGRYSVV